MHEVATVAVDASTATVLAALVLANIAGLVSAYVSIKIGLARLEVKVDSHDKDLNNLGRTLRENFKIQSKEIEK